MQECLLEGDSGVQRPKVSVIMSVFNEEQYLRLALESILHQTFGDFEFIIVNDGSTDRTEAIIHSFNDPRILLISQENRGLTKSLNRALTLARGIYIARMDGNDISERHRFERQVDFLDSCPGVGIVGSFACRIDERGRRINLYTYPTEDESIRAALWSTCPMCHSSVMFRSTCMDRVGTYREKVGPTEDLDFFFRVSENFGTANIPEPLHSFRVTADGITIRRRFDQMRYDGLVRMLARQRRETGTDRLEEMTGEEITEFLEAVLPKTPENEKAVINASRIHLAEIAYVSGDYRSSALWLSKYMLANPLAGRGWLLAVKLAAFSIVPKESVQRAIGMETPRTPGTAGKGS